jgi:monovalent cation:H+ antiporter, CPA1 family
MEVTFMTQTLSVLFLLIICSFTYIISKKIKFPYTVLLVIVGLLLIPISNMELFSFIDDFTLTPDLLFFVFLPVLLFEAAYNINYRKLLNNWKTITAMAVFWLWISAFLISMVLHFSFPYIWLDIPYLVCLMFWVIISATDPVAVLSIFKSLWAPRRLTILFEWESLFNDGTAVALFLIILWIMMEWWIVTWTTYLAWAGTFLSMIIGWILFWSFTWVLFSKIIGSITNNEEVEIVLTMLLAHITFILAEIISYYFGFLHISWVIATVVASIIIWNYGRYKITPRVEAHMQKFWEFFAFVSNSIIFILMWLILSTIDMNLSNFILPIIVVILTVMVIRVISVYIPISLINLFKIEKHIPSSWILLLSWGSLRWALALMMVLMIPWVWDHWYEALIAFQESVWWSYGFSIKDFLLVLTIWVIMFTLFIKAPIIPFIMKQLKIDRLYRLEEFKFEEWNILANLKIIDKLDSSYKKAYITQIEYDDLKKKYTEKLNIAVESMKNVLWNKVWESKVLIKKAISLHALWIEKEYLKSLFFYNEIWEDNFKFILRKIEKQIERLEWNGSQLKKKWSIKSDYDIFSRFFQRQYEKNSTDLDAYIRNRTRLIITRKVIKELRILSEIDFGFDNEIFEEVIELYAGFSKSADEKRIKLFSDHKATINAIESRLINKSLLKLEEQVIKDLYSKEIITPKLYIRFQENIEKEMYSDIRKFV